MPLPSRVDTPWPPKHLDAHFRDVEEAAAWYSGDTARLRSHYGTGTQPLPKEFGEQKDKGLGQRVRFWGRRGRDTQGHQTRQQLHVPLAADIASTSADLLFSEAPEFRIEPGEGQTDEAVKNTQERLDEIVHEADVLNTLLESGEVGAAMGGHALRVAWDEEVASHPLLVVQHADTIVPEFSFGRLRAVTFWRVLAQDSKDVWRHLERHEPGVILHGLYVGNAKELGRQIDLAAHPDTAELDDEIELPGGLRWAAFYVPNVLPNKRDPKSHLGRSDYQGTYDLMDALDETWTSWQRDIRLGQARIVTREEALTRGSGRGSGAMFDPDREVYVGLELDPSTDGKPLMEPIQFEIRVEQHEKTAMAQIERIVSTAGYSPQSFGLHIEGRAEAGTALRVREGKTLRTRDRKQRYTTAPLRSALEAMLVVDREVFGSGVEPSAPAISWGDAIVDDPRERAGTIQMLDAARAVSIETKVRMASPELEGEALQAEVDAILREQGMSVANPDDIGGAG